MQAAKRQAILGKNLDDFVRFTSSIAEGSTFTGNFSGGENIVVRGKVHGESDIQGAIVIADGGQWIGHLRASVVVVAGKVQGDITAREKIEVLAGASIQGNMTSPAITMETGAIHVGRLSMNANSGDAEEKTSGLGFIRAVRGDSAGQGSESSGSGHRT